MLAGGWILSCGGMYVLRSTQSGSLLLINTIFTSLGGGIRAAAIPEEDPSQISSTLEGPPARIPSSRGAPASLGAPSIPGLDFGENEVLSLNELCKQRVGNDKDDVKKGADG